MGDFSGPLPPRRVLLPLDLGMVPSWYPFIGLVAVDLVGGSSPSISIFILAIAGADLSIGLS